MAEEGIYLFKQYNIVKFINFEYILIEHPSYICKNMQIFTKYKLAYNFSARDLVPSPQPIISPTYSLSAFEPLKLSPDSN